MVEWEMQPSRYDHCCWLKVLQQETRQPYFFDQIPRLLFFRCSLLCGYLLEGGVYFFGKPADIDDGWIKYVRVKRWRLLDAVCSTRSPSVLLLAVETTRTTQIAPALACMVTVDSHTCACPAYTSRGCCLRAAFVWLLFECDDYSRAVSIRRNTVYVSIIRWSPGKTRSK